MNCPTNLDLDFEAFCSFPPDVPEERRNQLFEPLRFKLFREFHAIPAVSADYTKPHFGLEKVATM